MIKEVYACAVSDFVYITDNSYNEAEIRHMELRIIRANHLSPIFLRRYFKAGDVTIVVSEDMSVAKRSLKKIEMRYDSAEFQRVAINALGGMKNVLLISPTDQTCTILNILD